MAEIADAFGGKVAGELVRAQDWNGLIAAIEARFAALETSLDTRLDGVEGRVAASEAAIAALGQRLAPLETLAATVTTRFRRLDLGTAGSFVAIGQRAEIVARLSALDGSPLTLPVAAERPWIDFVAVWGALKPTPGFTSRGGSGNRTLSVQVNAAGEARALLSAEHADSFAEDQEAEVAGVMTTAIAGGNSLARSILEAPTPASASLAPVWQVITAAYDRPDSRVMQTYLDSYFVRSPAQSFGVAGILPTLNWRDTHAVVLAFAKPDDSPGTADGALATASIRVAFRDWVQPWIVTQYLPPPIASIELYRQRFLPALPGGIALATGRVYEAISTGISGRGVLGRQREFSAAREALLTLPSGGAPDYLGTLVASVTGGIAVQQGLTMSQSVSPLLAQDATPARAIGLAGVQGEVAAERTGAAIRFETLERFAASETRILDGVRGENARLTSELLAEAGPVRAAERIARLAESQVREVNLQLRDKAGLDVVSQILTARGIG